MPLFSHKALGVLLLVNVSIVTASVWHIGGELTEAAADVEEPADADPMRNVESGEQLAAWSSPRTDGLASAPLFTSSRKPPLAIQPPVSAASVPASPRLVGIVLDRVTGRHVMLESAAGNNRKLVGTGQEFEGWIVTEIRPGSIRLKSLDAKGNSNDSSDLVLSLMRQRANNP